jgi:hypothetical protein
MRALLAFALACGGDKGEDADVVPSIDDTADPADTATEPLPDPDGVPLGGVCEDANHWGAFLVSRTADYAYVSGTVSNAIVPVTELTRVSTHGDCTIWKRENPFCEPACTSDQTCSLSGECLPYPEAQDLGRVWVDGLLLPVAIDPVMPGYTYFDTSLPNPPWTPGGAIRLRAEGGGFGPFVLHAVAPDLFVADSTAWTLTEGEDLQVIWTPPTATSRTEVVMEVNVDQHGITPARVRCIWPDTGSGTLPGAALESLFSLGLSGFPQGTIQRRTADRVVVGEGCIDLQATDVLRGSVTITGYTPCTNDSQCPDGQSCNEALERCE